MWEVLHDREDSSWNRGQGIKLENSLFLPSFNIFLSGEEGKATRF